MALANKAVSAEEREEFVRLYKSGLSAIKISELTGRSPAAVYVHLRKAGIKRRSNRENSRRYKVGNPRYFQNIDTEQKAYLLGYIYADGYITKRRHSQQSDYISYQLGMSVQTSDIETLELLRRELETDYPVKQYTVSHGYKVGMKYERLLINSKELVGDLIKHGVIYNKSEIIDPPIGVPANLVRHFIRGYIDGDGAIVKNNTQYGPSYSVNIVGTDSVLEFIADYLYSNNLIKNKNKHEKRHKDDVVSYCRWGGNIQTYHILSHLYDNAHCYLSRKYNRYIDLSKMM